VADSADPSCSVRTTSPPSQILRRVLTSRAKIERSSFSRMATRRQTPRAGEAAIEVVARDAEVAEAGSKGGETV
jgi:hypothetical protein